MKTKAVRLYGKNDLRLEEFELPDMQDNEISARIMTDSICMSTAKLVDQGEAHKKAPNHLSENPIIIGHEFCGEILDVGAKWSHKYKVGEKFVIQANLLLPERPFSCPGYTYHDMGGDATYCMISNDVMQQDCLIPYHGKTYFEGSLIEPLSCVIGAFHKQYHTNLVNHDHEMGIKEEGNMLIIGGTGPMGLLAIDYALHGPRHPKRIVVTDHHDDKLHRAEKLYPNQNGIETIYLNTQGVEDEVKLIEEYVKGEKFDDIFVMSAHPDALKHASALAGEDACIDFFSGPRKKDFTASVNFYDVHYARVHYMGISGGIADDMREAVSLVEKEIVTPANIVTHILGLNAVADTTMHQREIGGAKKLVYTQKNMDLTALKDMAEDSPLGKILKKTDGIWSKEAEEYILKYQEDIN